MTKAQQKKGRKNELYNDITQICKKNLSAKKKNLVKFVFCFRFLKSELIRLKLIFLRLY